MVTMLHYDLLYNIPVSHLEIKKEKLLDLPPTIQSTLPILIITLMRISPKKN